MTCLSASCRLPVKATHYKSCWAVWSLTGKTHTHTTQTFRPLCLHAPSTVNTGVSPKRGISDRAQSSNHGVNTDKCLYLSHINKQLSDCLVTCKCSDHVSTPWCTDARWRCRPHSAQLCNFKGIFSIFTALAVVLPLCLSNHHSEKNDFKTYEPISSDGSNGFKKTAQNDKGGAP